MKLASKLAFVVSTFINLGQGGGTARLLAFYCGKLALVATHEGAVGIIISITLLILKRVLFSMS